MAAPSPGAAAAPRPTPPRAPSADRAFSPMLLARHGARPLFVCGRVVASAEAEDLGDIRVRHRIDLIQLEDDAIAVAIVGRRALDAGGDRSWRRCDAALAARDVAAIRALLEDHDAAALAVPFGMCAPEARPGVDAQAGDAVVEAWEAYLDEVEAVRENYQIALARLLDASAA